VHKKTSGIEEILEVSIGDALDKVLAKRLLEAVQLRAIEVAVGVFPKYLHALQAYVAREGHARVPKPHCELGLRLGYWLGERRSWNNNGRLSEVEFKALDALGVEWSPYEWMRSEGLRALDAYIAEHGNAEVPDPFDQGGFALGDWCVTQRVYFKKGKLTTEQVKDLNDRGFVWDVFGAAWDSAYQLCKSYMKANPQRQINDNVWVGEFGLGAWLTAQRMRHRRGTLSQDKVDKLTKIGVSWDPRQDRWQRGFQLFEKFVQDHGSSEVPKSFEVDGFRLGAWVSEQRSHWVRKSISMEKKQALDALGMVWKPYEDSWERMFAAFERWVARNGHSLVPEPEVEDELAIGRWAAKQRAGRRKGTLSADREKRLTKLGMNWNPPAGGGAVKFRDKLRKSSSPR